MYILGINAYHGDSSACLFKDDELIAATEEERIRREKHWAGLPSEAIKFVLGEAGISLKEVDYISVSRNPWAKVHIKAWYALGKLLTLKSVGSRVKNSLKINSLKADICNALGVPASEVKAKVAFVEHHRSHLACGFFPSPFEEAAILSLDGMGDFTSTMRAVGKGNDIQVLDSVSYPHSIGIFYTTFTQWLGFPHYGDEYKVMGLSPYGKPAYLDKVKRALELTPDGLFRLNPAFFKHFKEGVQLGWENGCPSVSSLFSDAFIEEFGPARQSSEPITDFHRDMAASVQEWTEQVIFSLATDLHKKTGLDNLVITGGVGQNSVANGKIVRHTPFKHLYVPPAAHDAGTSIGSALYLRNQQLKLKRRTAHYAYTGVHFTNDQIKSFLESRNIDARFVPDEQLMPMVADCLSNGGVVGWFQGRAEFGPRALGNRSILADPTRQDAKEILNLKIKRRESFRPFAPSILKEFVDDYFLQQDVVPYMEKVFDIRPEKHASIPAVTHVNGTGRLQTVDQDIAPRYHKLIKTFYEKSGVPILLNTSFNENEPIVNNPEHALDCYLRTKMDMLVLENYVIKRD
jgi:carbamoyltransferase